MTQRYLLLLFLLVFAVASCSREEFVAPIVPIDPVTAEQASLVSIQPTSATSAEVVVKDVRLGAANWRLSARAATGANVALMAQGQPQNIVNNEFGQDPFFSLTTYTASGLVAGQTYQFRLSFKFGGQDSITAVRSYTHQLATGPRWTRLAHAPFAGGDYTGCPVAMDGICGPIPDNGCGHPGVGAYVGNAVQILRYRGPDATRMDLQFYDRATNRWPVFPSTEPLSSRQGAISYNLFFGGVDRYRFTGLGYLAEERAPRKYFFYIDMYAIFPVKGSAVLPQYGGEEGELAFFTTTDEAYFLTQSGSPAMRSIHADFRQTVRAPLPEPPGTLATFSIRNIGYVVNQREGQPVRLWAYNPQTDTWQRKADFPGPVRQRGTGFAMARKGYFGLGLTPDGAGLRDVWQYDPATDRWQSIGEYPGQGNQLMAVFSAPDGAKPERAYLGWGYESQRTERGFNRVVGCTDWWELTP